MVYLINSVLLVTVMVLIAKWRDALRNPRGVEPATRPDLDRILLALSRIEKKLEGLTLQGPVAAPTEAVRTDGSAAAQPAGPSEVLAESHPGPAAPILGIPALDTLVQPAPVAGPTVPVGTEAGSPAPAGGGGKKDLETTGAVPERAGESAVPGRVDWVGSAREVPAWEKEARAILARIWSWILVGEEHRPKRMPLEFAMAGTWLMRVGVVVLVCCVAWFLKWSMAHGVLGPAGRAGLSFAAGVALIAAGIRQVGKRYQVLGQGLMGGGLAALYFAAYASGPMYHLLPQVACFAMMALITAAGCALASATRSQSIAILAMLGGYAVPVLLRTGVPNFPGLYAYLFVLGGGILALALLRNWRLLHYLAFAAHWLLVLGSLKDYEADKDFHVVLPFLAAFFLQQHGVAIGYALRRASPISLLEAIHQLALAALFGGLGYRLIDQAYGRPWPAMLAIGLGLLFVGQTLAVLRRLPGDRLSVSVSLGLAGFFAAWSVPLLTLGSTLVMAWSMMALAWLWIGMRIRSRLLVMGSQALLVLAGMRLASHDLPQAYLGNGGPPDWPGYLRGILPRLLNSGVYTASLMLASRWIGKSVRETGAENAWRLPKESDLPFGTPEGEPMRIAFFFAGLAALFVALHLEIGRLLSLHESLRAPGLAWLWALSAAYLAWSLRRYGDSLAAKIAVAGAVLAVYARMLLGSWPSMGLSQDQWYFRPSAAEALLRTLAHGTLLAMVYALATGRTGPKHLAGGGRAYGVAGTVFLFLVLTLETRTLAHAFFPGFSPGAVSLAWALFAMGLVAAGLRMPDRAARMAGLALFAGVTGKVFLADLRSLDMLWRVLSFMTVGAVLLLGSFAYLRAGTAGGAPAEPGAEKGK